MFEQDGISVYIFPFTQLHKDGALAVLTTEKDCSTCTKKTLAKICGGLNIQKEETIQKLVALVKADNQHNKTLTIVQIEHADEFIDKLVDSQYYEIRTNTLTDTPYIMSIVSYDIDTKTAAAVMLSDTIDQLIGTISIDIVVDENAMYLVDNLNTYAVFSTKVQTNLEF